MPCYVYLLGCKNKNGNRTYVGWTTNLDRRLQEHNKGHGARSTRGNRWTLLYAERHVNRSDALKREWYLKHDRNFRKKIKQNLSS